MQGLARFVFPKFPPLVIGIPEHVSSVSAISVDPSARGRQLRQRADNSVKLLARLSDNLTGDEVGERGSISAGQDVEHWPPNICLSSNIDMLINPMTIHVVLAVRVTVIQAVMVLALPPTGLLLQYSTM